MNADRRLICMSILVLTVIAPALIYGVAIGPKGDKKLTLDMLESGDLLDFPLGAYADGNSVGFAFGVKVNYNGGVKNTKLKQTEWSLSFVSYKKPKSRPGSVPRRDWWRLNGEYYVYSVIEADLKKFQDEKIKDSDIVKDDESELWNALLQGTKTGKNGKLIGDNEFDYVDLPGFPGKWAPKNGLSASIADSYKLYAYFVAKANTTDGTNLEASKKIKIAAEFTSDGTTWKLNK